MSRWWQKDDFSWRMVQTNLREIDMEDIRAEQVVSDLQDFGASVYMINTAGIIASYSSLLSNTVVSEYLHGDSLGEIVRACHEAGIRVIARMDFSKVRRELYEAHPDWAYRTREGGVVDYNGDVHVCLNGDYQQKAVFEILDEVLHRFDFDGVYFNMAGFHTRDYSYHEYGECHCGNCRKKFREAYGLELPDTADIYDAVYRKLKYFQNQCRAEYEKRIVSFVKEINADIAVNDVDYQRMESNTEIGRDLPLWQHSASSNTRCAGNLERTIRASNTSVDYMGYFYRHTAVSAHLQKLRLWQAAANLGGLDYYLIGRLDNHGDRSAFEGVKEVFHYVREKGGFLQQAHSLAQVLLIRTELWGTQEEERGCIRILSEAHIPLDECLAERFVSLEQLTPYSLVVLPDMKYLSDKQMEMLDAFAAGGKTVLATGETGLYDETYEERGGMGLKALGIRSVEYVRRDMLSSMYWIGEGERSLFPHCSETDYLAVGDTLVYVRPEKETDMCLKLILPHPIGPPERCYYKRISDIPGILIHSYGKGKGVYLPWKPGTFFYREGYTNTGSFMRDVLEQICEVKSISPRLTPMVETTLAQKDGRIIVQLVNLTGHYGNSFYAPVPVADIELVIPCKQEVNKITAWYQGIPVMWSVEGERLTIRLPILKEYEAIVIE